MSKLGPYLVFVILIVVGLLVFIKYYVGDLRPALLPSYTSESDAQTTPMNSENASSPSGSLAFVPQENPLPLQVEKGYKVGLVGRQAGARDIALSESGVIVVSSPSRGEVVGFWAENGQINKKVLISNLSSPHGVAFYQNKLFIAEDNRLSRYSWNDKTMEVAFEKEIMKLSTPSHKAHTIVFDPIGNLFIKIGSGCNVCLEEDEMRATVIKTDSDGNNPQIYARGLRNAAFMTLKKDSGEIWATENGRDFLGDKLPPDEINIIRQGDFGWPYCYGAKVHDNQFDGKNERNCDATIPALYELPAHTAPLGLAFTDPNHLLVALHGSWNSSVPVGYKVVKLTLENGKVNAMDDFLTGFIEGSTAEGRPVDIEVDRHGAIYVSDDKAGLIYVITR